MTTRTRTLGSRDLQKLLGLTRTQVLHWSQHCLSVPPAVPAGGTGRHQGFSPRNAIDLALVKELVACGLPIRRIRSILGTFRHEPYHEKDQQAAIALRQQGAKVDLSYDFLVIYRQETTGGERYVGRATGEGIQWWKERKPKRFVNEFVGRHRLAALSSAHSSVIVINVAALRNRIYSAIV